ALIALATLLVLPSIGAAQRRRPSLRRPTPRVAAPVLVPVGTNLKVRLNDTLSSKDSRAGDKFTATVMDPVRFNEATLRGHVRSIAKSGRTQGRTTLTIALDSITLNERRTGTVHGHVT